MEKGKRNKLKGMTLIEILIVVTLLGILAGVLVKSLGGSLQAGKDATVKLFATTTFKTACEAYKAVHGKYPANKGELETVMEGGTMPPDPWNGQYEILLSGTKPEDISIRASQGTFSTEDKKLFPFKLDPEKQD